MTTETPVTHSVKTPTMSRHTAKQTLRKALIAANNTHFIFDYKVLKVPDEDPKEQTLVTALGVFGIKIKECLRPRGLTVYEVPEDLFDSDVANFLNTSIPSRLPGGRS
ncbi:MAG: hypothetical protein ACOYNL_00750 [Rickettsiales bacterium]